MAGILKRLESWAADSPERSRFLVLTLCLGIGFIVLVFVLALAWLMLDPQAVKELTE